MKPVVIRAPDSAQYVLFVDVLGFAALTLSHPTTFGQIGVFDPHQRLGMLHPQESQNLLTVFSSFHAVLQHIAESIKNPPLDVVIFSDSAFLIFTDRDLAIETAAHMMLLFLRESVPVRMGLARGSYQAVRFDTARTQISSIVHIAQFLGTAVVYAVSAESKSKIKGMRIGVSPSVPTSRSDTRFLPLSNPSKYAKTEVNYLAFARHLWTPEGVGDKGRRWEAKNLISMVRALSSSAPDSERRHYLQTEAALRRMSRALGLGEVKV